MNANRLAAWGSVAAVAAAVVAGLLVTGTPAHQRRLRLDEQRVDELDRLNIALVSYRQEHERLPARLDELVDGRNLDSLPTDPSSGAPYEYRATGPNAFELCAVFDLPSAGTPQGDFWAHEAGRKCFPFSTPTANPFRP